MNKETSIGAALIAQIGDPDPEQDFARFDRIYEMRRMPWHKPMPECVLQAVGTRIEPFQQAVGQRPTGACDEVCVVRKPQRLNGHRLLARCHDGGAGQHPLQGEAIEGVKHEAASARIAERFAQLRPAVERAYNKAQSALFSQQDPHASGGGERFGTVFSMTDWWDLICINAAYAHSPTRLFGETRATALMATPPC
jgi:hypothetical protein